MTDRQDNKANLDRRDFFAKAAKAAGGVCLLGLGLGAANHRRADAAAVSLRPPGALPETDFMSACIRCGLCVRDCPYHTLSLAEMGQGVPPGTPFFQPRQVPCEMCENLPCITACPTGALDHKVVDATKIRMGTAVLSDHESCLNWQGLRCDVCYRVCPLIDKAITLEEIHNQRTGFHAMLLPIVHHDVCTGCGKCERSCVLEKPAIKVLPDQMARGKMGDHYRLGWEEKAKNGDQPLVDAPVKLPTRLPDGGYKGFKP